MAISIATSLRTAAANSYTFTTASTLGHTPATGNLVVIAFVQAATTAHPTGPSGWTLDRSVTSVTGSASLDFYSRVITGSEAATYQWTMSSLTRDIVIWEINPGGAVWATGVGASFTGNASSVTSQALGSSGTLASASSVALAAIALGSSRTGFGMSGGGTWALLAAEPYSDQPHYGSLLTSATTAINPTASWTTSSAVLVGGYQTYYTLAPVAITVTGLLNVNATVAKTVTGLLNVGGRVDKTVTGKFNVAGPVPTGWTVRTEADWGGDPLTRPASMTTVANSATTLSTKRGTQILQAGIETGTGTRKLDNSDRSLDPSNASSPLAPNVKPRTRMRDIITVGGTDYPLHTGFAERFPIEWSQDVGYCTVTTQDQLGLMATATLPPSVLHKVTSEFVASVSGSYWPMTETAFTGQADDVVGTLDGTYIGPVQQGQPVTAYDSRPNTKFAKPGTVNGDQINQTAMQVTGLSVPDTFSFACWFRYDPGGYDNVNPSIAIFQQGSPVTTDPSYPTATPSQVQMYLSQDSGISGRHHINIRVQNGSSIAIVKVPIAVLILDGQPHHLAFAITGATRSVGTWIDGSGGTGWSDTGIASTVALSTINVSSVISSLNTMGVGYGIDWNNVTGATAAVPDSATIGHTVYTPGHFFTQTEIDNMVAAGQDALDGQTTAQRLTYVLDHIGVDAGDRNAFAGSQVCGPTNFASQNAQQYIKKILATELSEIWIDGDGKWNFPARADYGTIKQIFSDDPSGDGGAAYAAITVDFSYDRLFNDGVIGRENGADQEVVDQASIDAYGPIAGTKYRTGQAGAASNKLDTLHQTAAAARTSLQWLIDRHKDPVVYIPSIKVSSVERTVSLSTMLLEVGDTVVVYARPAGGGSPIGLITKIEQVQHDINGLEWTVQYSLSDGTPYP